MKKFFLLLFSVFSLFAFPLDTFFVFSDGFFPLHIASDAISGVYVVSVMRNEIVHIDNSGISLRTSLPHDKEISDITRTGLEIIIACENTSELLYLSKRLMKMGSEKLYHNQDEIYPSMIFSTASRRIFIIDSWNRQIYIKDGETILQIKQNFPKNIGIFPLKNSLLVYEKPPKAKLLFDTARSDSLMILHDKFDGEKFIASSNAIYSVNNKELKIYHHGQDNPDSYKFDQEILDVDFGFGFLFILTEKFLFRLAI